MLREKPRQSLLILLIPALVVSVYLALVVRHTYVTNDGYVGALLDDTWIHVRFAHHIAQGQGLAYNEGVVTPGATSPLWVLTLAAIFAVFQPELMTQVHIAIALSALGAVLTVLAVTGFGWWASRRAWVGLLAGLITALTGRLIWMGLSGMEITTFTALCLLAVWSHTADMRAGRTFGWRTGIITALATLARPEGYLLAVVIGLDAFVLVPLRDGTFGLIWWQRVRAGWRGIVGYVMLAGSYPLVCLLLTGHPLPNTFRVKSQLGREWPELPYAFFWTPRVDHGWLLILLAGLGVGFLVWRHWTRRDRTGFAWALWPAAFVLAVLFLGAQHYVVNHARYVAPAIPFHALAAVVGLWALDDLLRARMPQMAAARILPAALGIILMGTALWLGRGNRDAVANDSAQLERMHVTAGYWFRDHTQPDDIIALNDVGAIVHIADRPVLDMVGLVSPEIIEAIREAPRFTCRHDLQIARVMLAQRPALVGVFPWFFPCLTSWPGALQPFTQFTITGPTVIAGGEMVVYWPVWENWPIQPEIPAETVSLEAAFEQGIHLNAYRIDPTDSGAQVSLWWEVDAIPAGDYTVFVHLVDQTSQQIVAQHDSRPQSGQFNTAWWMPGDIIADVHPIQVNPIHLGDPGNLSLRIGLYATGGGPRLPRIAAPIGEEEFVLLPFAWAE